MYQTIPSRLTSILEASSNRLNSDESASNWNPSNPQDCPNVEVDEKTLERYGWDEYCLDEPEVGKEVLAEARWRALRKPVQPEPYFEDVDYEPKAGMRLFDKFRQSGLQVIVKMASIELTPE